MPLPPLCRAKTWRGSWGRGASVDLLVEDLAADLAGRAFEIAQVAGGWMFRTRAAYVPVIRAVADVNDQLLDLSEFDVAVLAAIAYHQPITREGCQWHLKFPQNVECAPAGGPRDHLISPSRGLRIRRFHDQKKTPPP